MLVLLFLALKEGLEVGRAALGLLRLGLQVVDVVEVEDGEELVLHRCCC